MHQKILARCRIGHENIFCKKSFDSAPLVINNDRSLNKKSTVRKSRDFTVPADKMRNNVFFLFVCWNRTTCKLSIHFTAVAYNTMALVWWAPVRYTLSSVTGNGHVKYMASPFFDFYILALVMFCNSWHTMYKWYDDWPGKYMPNDRNMWLSFIIHGSLHMISTYPLDIQIYSCEYKR